MSDPDDRDPNVPAEPAAPAAKIPPAAPAAKTPPVEPVWKTRAGFVALIGAPNAGKSTLLNQLVGTKVSIVTHKVQTTRALIRGVCIRDDSQVIFVDTPGIFRPRRRLDRAMVTTAWGGAADADVVAVLIVRVREQGGERKNTHRNTCVQM